jgi:hypothetical protein
MRNRTALRASGSASVRARPAAFRSSWRGTASRLAGLILASVTVLAMTGAGSAAAGTVTVTHASGRDVATVPPTDPTTQNLLNVTGTVTYTRAFTPQNWSGEEDQSGTFTIGNDESGTWRVSDDTDITQSGGGCTDTITGSYSGSGTLNGDTNYDSVGLEYAPETLRSQFLDIAVGWEETFTETVDGPADTCGTGGTYTSFTDLEPQCYADDTAPQLLGTATGSFPDDAAIKFDCSGAGVIYMYDMIDSYSSSGTVHLACPGKSEMGKRIACIAEVAANPWPVGSWHDGLVPYSWGGGHARHPGPTLGTCEFGYSGPDKDHCKTYKKGPDFTVGLDCSGFTRWVYYLAYGRDVLGSSFNDDQRIHKGVGKVTKPSVGDLVFYGKPSKTHHIGIYVGKIPGETGNYIVNEYATGYRVQYNLVQASGKPYYYTYK